MNNKIKLFSKIIFSFTIVSILLFSACHKNEAMNAKITVKLMADNSIVMPGVRVILYKADVEIGGYTDGNGEFSYTFEHPVQLDIRAFNDTLSGIGVINLGEYGTDYEKTIFIF